MRGLKCDFHIIEWTGWSEWKINGTACETFQEYKERFCQIDTPLNWPDYKWVNVSESNALACGTAMDPVYGEVLNVIVRTNITDKPCVVGKPAAIFNTLVRFRTTFI